MRNIRPIFVTHNGRIHSHEEEAILDGIATILRIAGVAGHIEVKNFGSWNNGNQPYEDIDWYVQRAYNPRVRKNQIDAGAVLTECLNEPWQKTTPHYDVMAISHDLYVDNNNFVFGIGQRGLGTIISPFRYRCWDAEIEYELFKTAVIHELGHVFGLVDNSRKDLDYRLGPHCRNICAMRQGMNLDEWAVITDDRMKYETFCPRCAKDLKKYFI
jgi:predicted Zn-dependent protease